MNELVSIIIPVYNRSDLLGQTLDSLLSQSWTHWECIVVDDRSEDYISELMEFYCEKDARIRFYRRPANLSKGVSSCRNFGFEKSKGNYVNWFDSDDLMKKDFLNMKMSLFKSSPEIDYCLCAMQAFRILNGKLNIIRTTNVMFDNLWEDFVMRKFAAGTPSILWKKEILLQERILFDNTLSHSEDLELYSRIFHKNDKVGVIEAPLIMFRDHVKSLSGEFLEGSYLDFYLEVRQRIIDSEKENKQVERFTVLSVLDTFRRCLSLKYYEGCDKCLEFIFKNNTDHSIIFKLALLRIQVFYYVFRKAGRGETRFRRLLKIK